MMPKKKIAIVLLGIAIAVNFIILFLTKLSIDSKSELVFELSSDKSNTFQVFYGDNQNFSEEQSQKSDYDSPDIFQTIRYQIPTKTNNLRLDFGDTSSTIRIKNIYLKYKNIKKTIAFENLAKADVLNLIKEIKVVDNVLNIVTDNSDPYIVLDINTLKFNEAVNYYEEQILVLKKILMCFFANALLLVLFIFSNKFLIIPLDIYRNRKLILYLAKNDFKTKYAGSYFGIFWAFFQPIITILLYWFVFQVGFRSSSVGDIPFVLWLVAGLVPWFFYSDALSSATNSFIEYNYLVKKVVFNISILPMVKLGAAFFVHAFFICFTVFLFIINGYMPSIYTIQIIYYTLCMFALILSLAYITSSSVLFFRDLGQIINIYLQIAMWMTPIMWNYEMLPDKLLWIFKLNPMYYVVEGYRDSLINKIWFFDKLEFTIYFWVLIVCLFIAGTSIFKRLKPHFADVL